MQADSERLRDRLGAEAGEDAPANVLLARGEAGEGRARREERGERLLGRRSQAVLEMACHARTDGRCDGLKPRTLGGAEAALDSDAIEIDREACVAAPGRGRPFPNDARNNKEFFSVAGAVHARREGG